MTAGKKKTTKVPMRGEDYLNAQDSVGFDVDNGCVYKCGNIVTFLRTKVQG